MVSGNLVARPIDHGVGYSNSISGRYTVMPIFTSHVVPICCYGVCSIAMLGNQEGALRCYTLSVIILFCVRYRGLYHPSGTLPTPRWSLEAQLKDK